MKTVTVCGRPGCCNCIKISKVASYWYITDEYGGKAKLTVQELRELGKVITEMDI